MLLEARELFEVQIVKLAALRATDEDIKDIETNFNKVSGKLRSNIKNTGAETKTDLDTNFHLAIARASHNFVFVNIMRLHYDLLRDTRNKTWQMAGRRKEQHKEHQAIFQAVQAHDGNKAARAMLKHLRNIRQVIATM